MTFITIFIFLLFTKRINKQTYLHIYENSNKSNLISRLKFVIFAQILNQ